MNKMVCTNGLCFINLTLVIAYYLFIGINGEEAKTRPRSTDFRQRNGRFIWSPGEWKVCKKGKSCEEPGFQRRILSCLDTGRKKTYLKSCDRKLKPSRKRICVADECKNQTSFKLRFWPWSGCTSRPLSSMKIPDVLNGNVSVEARSFSEENKADYEHKSNWRNLIIKACGSIQNTLVFVKSRNISCIANWPKKNTQLEVPIDNCLLKSKQRPHSMQLCSFGCEHKCVVTTWAGWEPCETCRNQVRYRSRNVAFYQDKYDDAEKCPPLLQINASKSLTGENNKNRGTYQFKASEWSLCQTLDSRSRDFPFTLWNESARVGFSKRNLVCVDGENKLVKCADNKLSKIKSVKACVFPRNCHVETWGAWSSCYKAPQGQGLAGRREKRRENSFLRRRTRMVIITPLPGGVSCPHLVESESCEPPDIPKYEQEGKNKTVNNEFYQWFTGTYGKCKATGSDCRSGKKKRHVFCVRRGDPKHNPVASRFCAHLNTKPAEEAFCRIPCRPVCVLGEWGAWSSCTADCTRNSSGVIKGTHYRVRRLIQNNKDRHACKEYTESRPCELEGCFSWMAGMKTVCQLDNIHRTCGEGEMHRAVYCLNSRGRQVQDELCKGAKPPRILPCHVPCADDCVVGTWSKWGPCEGECGLDGKHKSSSQQRLKRILAHPGWSGRQCSSKREMSQSQSCLGNICGTYHWEAGLWGSCTAQTSRLKLVNNRCFLGKATRNVTCMNDAGKVVKDDLCTTFLKPSIQKECLFCPRNCVLSPWTTWTECPALCSGSGTLNKPVRTRQRYIIIPGEDGGALCPDERSLKQEERCKNCKKQRWRYNQWSKCMLVSGGGCKGFKTRRVYCTNVKGGREKDGYCLENEKPPEIMECEERCNEDCLLENWSSWSGCSKACGKGTTKRLRNIIGNRIRCSPDVKFSEERPCNTHRCGHYSMRIGRWSTCYAKDGVCGAGLQWRNISCFKISGPEAPLTYCIEELYGGELALKNTRHCEVECPKDCKLSPWTKFTPCSRICGAGVKTRYRTVIQRATHGGKPCVLDGEKSQVSETVSCRVEDCFNFVWRSEPWNECQLVNQTQGRITKCGTGFHTRKVLCVDKRYSGLRSILNDSFCDALEKPETRKSCTLACPGDCVVGYWSSWTRCSLRCPRPGHRRRERAILRHPAHDGKSCPVLEGNKTCNDERCHSYHWSLTQWSSCQFYQDNSSCGIGRQARMTDCRRSDGKIVHPFFCRVEGRRIPMLLRMCTVPCPRNCELSEWGSWTPCPESCGVPATQIRTRFISAHSKNGGQPCLQSEALKEFRACQVKPCYKVAVEAWTKCVSDIPDGCGVGRKTRSVHCSRDDGKIAKDFLCPKIESEFPREQTCRIPCKADCVTTDWTPWSKCFGSCSVANKTVQDVGLRIRTRLILQQAEKLGIQCPKDLVEKEQCSDPSCFTFAWRASAYRGKQRHVWCERSDGVNVTNGCISTRKPSATKSCQPACSVSNSFCNVRALCVCRDAYIPILGSNGNLIHCLSDSNPAVNGSFDINTATSNSGRTKDKSWFADLPIIIWVVIGVCFVYFLLFLAIVIVYTRRRTRIARQRRANTSDVGTITTPERIPLTEKIIRHERSESKASFATSSGRGSTLSAISDHDDAEQWPQPPDDVVSEYIRTHLKNFNQGSFCSDYSHTSLDTSDRERTLNSLKKVQFDNSGTL